MSRPESSEAPNLSLNSLPCRFWSLLGGTFAMSSPGLRAPTTQAWAHPAQGWPSHQAARAVLSPPNVQDGTNSSDTSSDKSRHQQELAGPGPGSQSLQLHRTNAPYQHHHQVVYDPYKWEKLLLSGGIAGAISRTLTAPIDRLKMILQVQDDSKRGMTLREGVQRMRSEGSWTTFFKGNGANVLKIAPETAMKLTLNDVFKAWIQRDHERMTAAERMAAGGLAGAVAQFLTYPLDTIRTRLAVSRHGTYQGIFHAAALMRRDEGLTAFYRGLTPSMIGILPYAGVDIALFEIFKQELLDHANTTGAPLPNLSLLLAGMLSSSIAQIVSYPLALIRTRLQAQGVAGAPLKYMDMHDVLNKTLEREGFRGLYKGLLPNIFKLAPAAGISWYVFEESKRALGLDPRI